MGDVKKDLLERFFSVKEGWIFFIVSSIILYPFMKVINSDAVGEVHLAHAIWYVGILFVMWFLFLLHIGLHIAKNMWLVKKYIIVSIASSVAFIAYFFSDLYKPIGENTEYIGIVVLNFILFLLALYMYQKYIPEKVLETNLFQEQQADIKRIIEYLNGNCNILGIEAVFGNGKTFLLQELKSQLENSETPYEFLEIDVIACNLDSLADVLVKEIDTILYKNQVISKFSNRLRKFFSQKQEANFLGELIFGKQETYSNIFKGFKDELERTGKTIVLLYEDLDRIRDSELIRKIFYISEKLSSDKIKVIYQYNGENLSKLGFDRNYLDKYIPYQIHLSQIDFRFIVEHFMQEDKNLKELVNMDDIYNLPPYFILSDSTEIFADGIGPVCLAYFSDRLSIRRVKHFLYDLLINKINEASALKREILIAMAYIKHFLPEIYREIASEKDLMGCFLIEQNGRWYTLPDLIAAANGKQGNDALVALGNPRSAAAFFAPVSNQHNFEKYIAFKLLKMDTVIERPAVERQERNE